MKIRGTAQHIGEKYLQLARDAQTSGDPVAAESYLQHAEHYFRIIAAAQQALYQAQSGYIRQPGEAEAEDQDDDDDLGIPDRFALPSERVVPSMPVQPQVPTQAQPPQTFGERPNGQERSDGQERPYRQERFPQERDQRNDRGSQFDRQGGNYERTGQERNGFDRDRQPQRGDRPDRGERNPNRPRFGQEFRERDTRDMQFREQPRVPAVPREQPAEARTPAPALDTDVGADLPAFITAPVRVAAPQAEPASVTAEFVGGSVPGENGAVEAGDPAAESFAVRPRRRRRTRLVPGADLEQTPAPQTDDSSQD